MNGPNYSIKGNQNRTDFAPLISGVRPMVVDLPDTIRTPLRTLLPLLESLHFSPIKYQYSAEAFGNFLVSFRSPGGAGFQLTRDRSQFLVDGPSQHLLEQAGLFGAFDDISELQPLLLAFLTPHNQP